MKQSEFYRALSRAGACRESLTWVSKNKIGSPKEAAGKITRSDWFSWLLARLVRHTARLAPSYSASYDAEQVVSARSYLVLTSYLAILPLYERVGFYTTHDRKKVYDDLSVCHKMLTAYFVTKTNSNPDWEATKKKCKSHIGFGLFSGTSGSFWDAWGRHKEVLVAYFPDLSSSMIR